MNWNYNKGTLHTIREHCSIEYDIFMGQYVISCAHVHTPFAAGTGSYCYLSSCLVPEFPTFSPEVVALPQDCHLHKNLTCSSTTGV
jgi:hypothetical protein